MALTFKHKPGLVTYVTCGDPSVGATSEIVLAAINAGADVIELGVPFSDPVADGPVIQRASERALRNSTTLKDVLEVSRAVRRQSGAGIIIFSYFNPILKYGLARFCAKAVAAGVDGALITDLPVEEAGEYLRLMRKHKLATVFLVAPTSPDERLKRIAQVSTGFVYAISRTGVTGGREEHLEEARELVGRLRRFTRDPIAVGFGISTAEQVAAVGAFADAAVVGSALMQAIEKTPDAPARAVAQLVQNLRSLSAQQGLSTGSGK